MAKVNIHELLEGKWEDGTRPKDIYALYVSKRPSDFSEAIVRGLRAGNRRIENGCAEIASLLSEKHPEVVYPHVSVIIENLGAKEPVLRWEAACTLGNLAAVDRDGQVFGCLKTLFGFLNDKSIVLQGHSVKALAKIAKAHPREAPTILKKLMEAAGSFPGNRVGCLIEAMESFLHDDKLKKKIVGFVEPYGRSDIKSVAKKAGKVLKKIG